ncbi:hypothetical protein [Longimicrobium sp.]|uniref:hypothetical protein n=1 Tax=Longimicrobium sp. TaxID=2029185 RepID=UPI002CFD023D|nr:hypothetical protein [Longimicrobium sp.]HSU12480.1 hypothetical protein [Longimicrobium sp.]
MAESKKPRAQQPGAEAEVKEQEMELAGAAVPTGSMSLAEAGVDAPVIGAPVGGFSPDFMPAGASTGALALGADVTGGLTRLAPTFGEVLLSVGQGVAESQAALDRSLIDTAKELSKTKIKVVTDVIQKLDDDGLPDAEQTQLITEDVSLINFLSPEVHEWKNVAISMDFEVGAIDSERGVQFKQSQGTSKVQAGASFWGFGSWFNYDYQSQSTQVNSHSDSESSWATGQVKLDATLAPRRTEKFTAPSQVVIGPQIFFAQGAITRVTASGKETARSMPITVTVLKASGEPNPNAPLVVECDKFGYSFVADAPFKGSLTNPDGQVKVMVTRQIPDERFSAAQKGTVTVRLGAIVRTLEIVL